METPSRSGLISARGRRLMSTSASGRVTSSFIRSRMFVPPARNRACGLTTTARAAASASAARRYSNGLMGALLPHTRQLPLVGEPPALGRLPARVDFLDRLDDPRIRPAAAD